MVDGPAGTSFGTAGANGRGGTTGTSTTAGITAGGGCKMFCLLMHANVKFQFLRVPLQEWVRNQAVWVTHRMEPAFQPYASLSHPRTA